MRSLLQFLAVSGAMIAVNVGLLGGLWALSLDGDPSDEKAASSLLRTLLWSAFWPLMWPYLWLTGKNTAGRSRKAASQAGMPERRPRRFRSIGEAKEYLAGAIAAEAEREGTPLTEVERKMLFFTEAGRTLPDMKEVSTEFDRSYNQDAYEQRIAAISNKIRHRFADQDQQQEVTWDLALEKLSRGDHYLLVLAGAAHPTRKGPVRILRILVSALIFLALAWLDSWFRGWLRNH